MEKVIVVLAFWAVLGPSLGYLIGWGRGYTVAAKIGLDAVKGLRCALADETEKMEVFIDIEDWAGTKKHVSAVTVRTIAKLLRGAE